MLVYICQVYSIFIKCLLYNIVYNYCLVCKVFILILLYSPPIYYPYVTIPPPIYPMKIDTDFHGVYGGWNSNIWVIYWGYIVILKQTLYTLNNNYTLHYTINT